MVLEHVHITISPGQVTAYLSAFERARPQVLGQPGCRSCRLLPKLDAPGEFLLLVEWERRTDHTEGFRRSAEYLEWSRLLHHFYAAFPTVTYYQL